MAMFEPSELSEWNDDEKSKTLSKLLFSNKEESKSKQELKKRKKKVKGAVQAIQLNNENDKDSTPVREKSRKQLYQKRRKLLQLKRKLQSKVEKKLQEAKDKCSSDAVDTEGQSEPDQTKITGSTDAPHLKKKKQSKDKSELGALSTKIGQKQPNDGKAQNISASVVKKKKKQNVQAVTPPVDDGKVSKKSKRNKYKHLAGKGKLAKYLFKVDDANIKSEVDMKSKNIDNKNAKKSKDGNKKKSKENIQSDVSVESIKSSEGSLKKQRKEKKMKKNKNSINEDDHGMIGMGTDIAKSNSPKKRKVGEQSENVSLKKQKLESPVTNKSKNSLNISKLKQYLESAKSEKANLNKQQNEISQLEKNTQKKKLKEKSQTIKISPQKQDKKSEPTLRMKMEEKLKSARFRYLNEMLYKTSSSEAKSLFQQDRDSFYVYHEGFQSQVEKWPTNPIDKMVSYIKLKPASSVIADFGCGDAKLAQSVDNKVHSFDLVAVNKFVTACDMASVPLPSGSVDIAVFCLSLMGTNIVDFLREAHRVLKTNGKLLIAEVVSRFEKVGKFVRKLESMGFSLLSKDTTNTMFIWFEFSKVGDVDESQLPQIELMPCIYKKR